MILFLKLYYNQVHCIRSRTLPSPQLLFYNLATNFARLVAYSASSTGILSSSNNAVYVCNVYTKNDCYRLIYIKRRTLQLFVFVGSGRVRPIEFRLAHENGRLLNWWKPRSPGILRHAAPLSSVDRLKISVKNRLIIIP